MVIVFDGVCNVCNDWVQFVIAHDRGRLFQFAPAQTEVGRRLMTEAGVSADRLDSMVLFDGARYFTRSDAVLQVLKLLGGWPSAFALLRLMPKPIRDRLYDAFARRRYRLFGRRDACMVPSFDVRDRFLA